MSYEIENDLKTLLLELTPYQKTFYNEWLLHPERSDYNMVLDQVLTGELDITRLNNAVKRTINEHLLISSNIIKDQEKVFWKRRNKLDDDADVISYYEGNLSDEEILKMVQQPFNLENDLLIRAFLIKRLRKVF